MSMFAIVAETYFDGTRYHKDGPFTIEIVNGVIQSVFHEDFSPALSARNRHLHGDSLRILKVPFVMPGLVEAHCHLFLDGAELDPLARKNYLKAPRKEMLHVARHSLRENLHSGITSIRDAGDLHGINTQLKAETDQTTRHWTGPVPEIISAGRAIRKAGRYGAFMALEVSDADSIVRTIYQLAPAADQLKVLLTGIIDFESGRMKGGPQFDLAEAKLIVRTARELGRRTFAHCSGQEGLRIAVEAGFDSIEHGFFMSSDVLRQMADKQIAWVPTFSPVYFQYAHPELCGWTASTVTGLRQILDQHFENVALAHEMGVPVVAGSDAGSYGVPHGRGLIDELIFQHRAGMPLDAVLASATSVPRRLWGIAPADIAPGHQANFVVFRGSPFESIDYLRQPQTVIVRTGCHYCAAGNPSLKVNHTSNGASGVDDLDADLKVMHG